MPQLLERNGVITAFNVYFTRVAGQNASEGSFLGRSCAAPLAPSSGIDECVATVERDPSKYGLNDYTLVIGSLENYVQYSVQIAAVTAGLFLSLVNELIPFKSFFLPLFSSTMAALTGNLSHIRRFALIVFHHFCFV